MSKSKSPPQIAQVIARRRERVLARRSFRSLIGRVLLLALVGYVLFTQVFLVTQITGQDMFPAMKDGDLCFLFRTRIQTLMKQKYVRGDIVAYRIGRGEGESAPLDPVRQWILEVVPQDWLDGWLTVAIPREWLTGENPGKRYFGRVIATDGDVVNIGETGSLIVNGTTQGGEIMFPTELRGELEYPYRVPEGCVYVLGDYRINTTDSRDFGPIPLEEVEGKLFTLLRRRGL